ncbi:helix-turn-helix domain-containing protein [Maritalea mediterranea]|uniref:Helix-turn-helix transcriptional regulator n=1 Tax=Maritalea mediterranea TaxID=2909667 RepID=A0ABS9E629_9HYPH|nr:helix-turn-helix transcriptional regulator [Maritalea mediterranea]MCF4098330.1 helix-turn-helix transcriptional regulator [Maritalea mediterranea]
MAKKTRSDFSSLLKDWRQRRRFSQLDLSLEAGLSQRHLSFLETGRARPSRQAISQLGVALDMPAGEVDNMLMAAGFTARSDATQWSAQEREAIEQSIDHVLNGHNPYPAVSIDCLWQVQKTNKGADGFFALFGLDPKPNLLRAFLQPGPLRASVVNWDEMAQTLMRLLHYELARHPNKPGTADFLAELKTLPGVATLLDKPITDYPAPVLTIHIRMGGADLRFFSLTATIGASTNAALDELRLETMLPADQATRDWFARNV